MVRTCFTAPPKPLSLNYLPPCVCNVGDIPFAEYTRRLCSNIRSKGGVCIMPTTRVCVVSVIVREKHSCFYHFVSANHTKTFNDAQA